MSKWSGKCDVYDWFNDRSDEYIAASTFYLGKQKLNIKNHKDLMPYYAYLIAGAGATKDSSTVYLTEESFVDQEEKEHFRIRLQELIQYWKSTDKYNKNEAYKIIEPFGWKRKESRELVDRVAKFGDKATIDGLHDSTHERYRQELCDYMIKNGYSEDEACKLIFKERADEKKREKETSVKK